MLPEESVWPRAFRGEVEKSIKILMSCWINTEDSQDKKPNLLTREWFNARGKEKKD